MAAGWKDDWYPQNPIGTGFGAWFGTLLIPYVLVCAIGDAAWNWGAAGWWIGGVLITAFSLGVGFDQWETRKIQQKNRGRQPELPPPTSSAT